jgi:hypothetical protein
MLAGMIVGCVVTLLWRRGSQVQKSATKQDDNLGEDEAQVFANNDDEVTSDDQRHKRGEGRSLPQLNPSMPHHVPELERKGSRNKSLPPLMPTQVHEPGLGHKGKGRATEADLGIDIDRQEHGTPTTRVARASLLPPITPSQGFNERDEC